MSDALLRAWSKWSDWASRGWRTRVREGNDCCRIVDISLWEDWDEVRARNLVWQLWILDNCESTWREEIDEHPKQETFPVSVENNGYERLQGEIFSKIGQSVHRWWQRGIEWRTNVKVQILSAYYVVSQQRKNGHPKHGTTVVYEVEKSDSVGDETVETFEVRQRHGRHVNCVWDARQQWKKRTVGQTIGSLHRLWLGERASDTAKHKWCGDHVDRSHEIACSPLGSGLNSSEAEVMTASENIKEALLLHWFGTLWNWNQSGQQRDTFFHRRSVGRMKHINSRILWLQDLIAAGGVRLKKIPRSQNLADMLTHTQTTKELEVFLSLMSLKICNERDKELMTTRQLQTSFSWNFESVLLWLKRRVESNCVFHTCTSRLYSVWLFLRRTMSTQHWSRVVTLQTITSGNQSRVRIAGGNLDTVSYWVMWHFLLDMWSVICLFFLRWNGVVAQATRCYEQCCDQFIV